MRSTHLGLGLVLLALVALPVTGCYKHTFRTGAKPASSQPDLEKWQNNFFWGLINASGEVKVDQLCPKGPAIIHNRVNFWNGVLSAITAGIYGPTTVQVWCAADGSMRTLQLDVTPELLRKGRALDPDFDARVAASAQQPETPRIAAIEPAVAAF